MKEHEKILQLIESVDLSDTGMLDEIDCRVWNYIGVTYNGAPINWDRGWHPYYTRSRDALKEIRPDGWRFNMSDIQSRNMFYALAETKDLENYKQVRTGEIATEELAELHAIIQAIAYERQNNG